MWQHLANALLSSTSADEVAVDVADQLGSLGFTELATRAGRQPGRGYVHETDATWKSSTNASNRSWPTFADEQRSD